VPQPTVLLLRFASEYGSSVQERIIQVTSELVAIPTHEREREAQERIASWLSACGFDCELRDVAEDRPNVIARRGTGGAFLNSHVDVHPPHRHPDPFTARRQGDLLVGRGVLDAKGQIAALITAVEAEPDADACVVITCDEETGGLGSEHLAVPDGPWTDEGGIVLEPTDFAICTAQSGNIDVRVEVSGTPTHAYAPETTGSPIKAVLSAIEELDTCSFLRADHPLVGRPRVNVGRLRGGEHAWRTPARARLEMTLGVVPGTDLAGAENEVRQRLDECARRWGARGTSFLYEIADTSEPIEVPWGSLPIAKRLADALETPLQPSGMPAWTDAGNLLTKHGLPCVVFGAGELAPAHSNHEWVRVADLVRLCDVLRNVLRSA
jgi:acetylornithine deacetylase/succinyl-diaminopimelate desuccinylase-like protein